MSKGFLLLVSTQKIALVMAVAPLVPLVKLIIQLVNVSETNVRMFCFNTLNHHYYAAITCSPLMSPTNGTVSYGGVATDVNGNLLFNVMATYSCDTGFALVDNSSRTCTGDGMSVNGSFNGTAPTCDRECSSHT